MRVLVVLCLAFAFVAAQDDADDTTSAPESVFSCIRRTLRSAIEESKTHTRRFLEGVSPKEDIDGLVSQISAEYDLLQQKMINTTEVILEDRETCEKNNEKAVFKRNCDLLAKLSLIPKGTRHIMVFVKNSIWAVTNAHLNITKGGVSNVLQFVRSQGTLLLTSLRDAVYCIRERN